MALAIWQATITDQAGNIQGGASIEVRAESDNSLVSLYSDRDGMTPLGNPFTADSSGYAAFHVEGGAYKITATKGSFTYTLRYVAVGTAAEQDLADANSASGVSFTPGSGIASTNVQGAIEEVSPLGKHQETIYAASWSPTVTNGAGRSYEELASNDIISDTLDFDTSTQEFATAIWCPPKSYNGSTITFRYRVRLPGASSAQTVDLALSGAFIRNDDAVDATLGTPVVVTDTFIAAGDLHVSSESTAVTINGTYAEGCKVSLKLQRNVSTDNAGGDAKVEAVDIFWTSNAASDS